MSAITGQLLQVNPCRRPERAFLVSFTQMGVLRNLLSISNGTFWLNNQISFPSRGIDQLGGRCLFIKVRRTSPIMPKWGINWLSFSSESLNWHVNGIKIGRITLVHFSHWKIIDTGSEQRFGQTVCWWSVSTSSVEVEKIGLDWNLWNYIFVAEWLYY